jgi:hypothetical protein
MRFRAMRQHQLPTSNGAGVVDIIASSHSRCGSIIGLHVRCCNESTAPGCYCSSPGFLFSICPSDSAFDLNAIAKDVEQRFRACPRREVVFKTKRLWQKEAWGPPSDVIADVKPSDSSLYPYVLTVEFNLRKPAYMVRARAQERNGSRPGYGTASKLRPSRDKHE